MENATKALLIAAAILVAIVIISIGMVVLNQGTGTSEQAGAAMSDAEVSQFNATFTNYCGNSVNGSQLMDLLKKVKSNNADEKDSGEARYVSVEVTCTTDSSVSKTYGGVDNDNLATIPSIPKSASFRVKVKKEYSSGVVEIIEAIEK